MIGRDYKQIKDLYEWKKEQLKELRVKVPSDEFLYNKYDVIKDKMGNIKVGINIFKGISYSNYEAYQMGKLKIVRLKIDLSRLLKLKALSFTDLAVKENIENFDIQFEILDEFLKTRYTSNTVRRALMPIWEKYDSAKQGEHLGTIWITYSDFVSLNEFLKYYSLAFR